MLLAQGSVGNRHGHTCSTQRLAASRDEESHSPHDLADRCEELPPLEVAEANGVYRAEDDGFHAVSMRLIGAKKKPRPRVPNVDRGRRTRYRGSIVRNGTPREFLEVFSVEQQTPETGISSRSQIKETTREAGQYVAR